MKATVEQVKAQQSKMTISEDDVCTCCGKPLKQAGAAWLELSFITNKYYIDNVVPQQESQGYFPFGLTCAKKIALAVYN
jgi:hypothetical protein